MIEGIFGNSNTFALWLLTAFGYYLISNINPNIRYPMLFITLLLIVLTGSRTTLLSLLIMLLGIRFVRFNKLFTPKHFIFVLFTLLFLTTYAYLWLYNSKYGVALNLWSNEAFDKNFFSGRQVIWAEALDKMEGIYWLIGFGSGATGKSFLDIDLSIHNSYLQILIQSGLIGVVLITSAFIALYRKVVLDEWSRKSLFITVAILICANFEVILFQNKLSVFIFMLPIIISCGCNKRY
ncbi:O-antigen ligase family protein [Vibrio sp. 10N.222.54.B12]|uniref:O-antigen ligase family protein n=1 Tax=Vibrio sp. 10N.222.54.B12 TaxID=3229636 RepID=UPI003551BDB3